MSERVADACGICTATEDLRAIQIDTATIYRCRDAKRCRQNRAQNARNILGRRGH